MTQHHILEDLKLQQHYCDSHKTQKVIWELLWGFHFMTCQSVVSSWRSTGTYGTDHPVMQYNVSEEQNPNYTTVKTSKCKKNLHFGQCNMTMAKVTWTVW